MIFPEQFDKDLIKQLPVHEREACIIALLGLMHGYRDHRFVRLYNFCVEAGLLKYQSGVAWDKQYVFTPKALYAELGDDGWLKLWRLEFKTMNKDRVGSLAECKRRWRQLKTFRPDVTPALMTKARDIHFMEVGGRTQFICKSHKFIWRQVGLTGAKEYPALDILIKHGYLNE